MNSAQPIPVIPLEYAQPAAPSRWVGVGRWTLGIAAIDVVVGWVLILAVDVQTVMVTGAILFVLGLMLLYASWRMSLLVTGILGLAHCSICLLYVMLVNVLDWMPADAAKPFAVMTGVYLFAVVVPMTAVAWGRLRGLAGAVAVIKEMRDLPSARGVAEDRP